MKKHEIIDHNRKILEMCRYKGKKIIKQNILVRHTAKLTKIIYNWTTLTEHQLKTILPKYKKWHNIYIKVRFGDEGYSKIIDKNCSQFIETKDNNWDITYENSLSVLPIGLGNGSNYLGNEYINYCLTNCLYIYIRNRNDYRDYCIAWISLNELNNKFGIRVNSNEFIEHDCKCYQDCKNYQKGIGNKNHYVYCDFCNFWKNNFHKENCYVCF